MAIQYITGRGSGSYCTEVHGDKGVNVVVVAHPRMKAVFDAFMEMQDVCITTYLTKISPLKILKSLKYIRNSDLVYFHSPANMRILLLPLAKLFGKKTIVQWTGTDVSIASCKRGSVYFDVADHATIAVKKSILSGLSGVAWLFVYLTTRYQGLYLRFLKLFVDQHAACAHHLVDELKAAGIDAVFLPLIVPNCDFQHQPLPERCTFLTYIGCIESSDTRNHYGWKSVVKLAHDYPGAEFIVIGAGSQVGTLPDNVRYLGFVSDVNKLLDRSTCLLRISYHEGMPRLIVEALAKARYVIYTYSMQGCITIEDYGQLKEAVAAVCNQDKPNYAGASFVSEEFSLTSTTRRYMDVFSSTLAGNTG